MNSYRSPWLRTTVWIKKELTLAFILGTLLFVVVAGVVDAGLPWPDPKSGAPRPAEKIPESRS
jgi:hypothetical protein